MRLSLGCVLVLMFAAVTQSTWAGGNASRDNSSMEVDAAIRQLMKEQKIPGLGLVVARNKSIVKADGYGLANIESRSPASPETVFEAGSITKQFTATAIMLLADEGKLALDDSIGKYFPETPPAQRAITIRHLLTHTSGIPDVSDGTDKNGDGGS